VKRRLKNRWNTSDRNCVELFYNLSECGVAAFLLEGMLHSSMQALQMLLFIRQFSSFLVGASRFPCMVIITCMLTGTLQNREKGNKDFICPSNC